MINLDNPCSESFWLGTWNETARKNSEIFEEVFNCLPCNKVKKFEQLWIWEKRDSLAVKEPLKANLMLQNVRGTLVHYPLKFLTEEPLVPITNKIPGYDLFDRVYFWRMLRHHTENMTYFCDSRLAHTTNKIDLKKKFVIYLQRIHLDCNV